MASENELRSAQPRRFVVLGAGIIGLSCADALLQAGHTVSIVDPNPPETAASWAAAGMLAPAFEAAGDEGVHPKLFEACLESRKMWQACFDRGEMLQSALPAMAIATTSKERARLERIAARLTEVGMPPIWLGPTDLQRLEPTLSDEVKAGLLLETDTHINPRDLVARLRHKLSSHFDMFSEEDADLIIEAKGWRSQFVSPVKGQMLALGRVTGHPDRSVRKGSVYVVPREEITLIGASVEPGQQDLGTDDEALSSLRAEAARAMPGLANGSVVEAWAGIRPRTADHAPVIGWLDDGRRIIASGHYRNGVLLAPLTARLVCDLVDGHVSETDFSPHRFASSDQAAISPGNDIV